VTDIRRSSDTRAAKIQDDEAGTVAFSAAKPPHLAEVPTARDL
jgi:hypothetical protein